MMMIWECVTKSPREWISDDLLHNVASRLATLIKRLYPTRLDVLLKLCYPYGRATKIYWWESTCPPIRFGSTPFIAFGVLFHIGNPTEKRGSGACLLRYEWSYRGEAHHESTQTRRTGYHVMLHLNRAFIMWGCLNNQSHPIQSHSTFAEVLEL